VRQLIAIAIITCASAAHADDMAGMTMTSSAPASSHVDAGVSFVAASYQQTNFGGNYQGVMPELMWSSGRWMAGASLGLYRIFENGSGVYGPGDLMLHASVALVERDTWRAGLMLAGTAPTGNMYQAFGMGHPMLMPSAWASWTVRRITLSATSGWGGMLGGDLSEHMMTSIVDPMNASELEWSAAIDVPIGLGMHGSVLGQGGIPVGEPGVDRVVGAIRLAWGSDRVETAAELAAGIAGDPFRVRGLVETALHF